MGSLSIHSTLYLLIKHLLCARAEWRECKDKSYPILELRLLTAEEIRHRTTKSVGRRVQRTG